MRKVRFRKRTDILNHLNSQRDSGKTVEGYCLEHGIASSTFFNWRKKYLSSLKPVVETVSFGHVTVLPSSDQCIEIRNKDLTVLIPAGLFNSPFNEIISTLHGLRS